MSRAALAREADTSKSSGSRRSANDARVSHASDAFEIEADRVADTVTRGCRVAGWSLSSSRFDGIHRQPAPASDKPAAGDIAGSLAEALMATSAARHAVDAATPAGHTLSGPAAVDVLTALAKAKKSLPAHSHGVSLAMLKPGLSAQIDYQGPLSRPTRASITLSHHSAPGAENPKPLVHRKAAPSTPLATGSADVDSVLRSPGHPLDTSIRRDMESRIGFDFRNVRLHTDSRAAESAHALSAQAYTVGDNVVFAPGRYAPHSTEGRHLLAHELTHVVQQTASPERAHPTVRQAPRQVQRKWGIDPNGRVADYIRGNKAYPLFCVVVGEDLITGEQVKRDATTLTDAVLTLIPEGKGILDKLKKAKGALDTAFKWLSGRIAAYGFNAQFFSDLWDKLKSSVSLWSPRQSYDNLVNALTDPLHKLIALASEVGAKVLDFILQAALDAFGETGRKVYDFFKRAGNVISRIAADPLKFAANLFAAIQLGFKNFGKHILTHLGEGLKEWIFDELAIKGVSMPTDFTLSGMFRLLLQVLGLTYEQRRPQLVEKLGEPAVYFFETSGKVLTRVQKEGFSAIKDMILEKAESVYDSLKNSIKNWVAKEVVERGVEMVAKLSNPAGELIQAVESIYETVRFIIEKASKLADLINTVLNALSDIMDGTIGPAAQKVEDSLAKTIRLVLGFIAGQLHLTGIGKAIRDMIDRIRAPIDAIVGKVLDFIVDKAKGSWETNKAAFTAKLDGFKQWWTKPKPFKFGEEDHEVNVEGDGAHAEVFVHSEKKTPLKYFLIDVKADKQQTKAILDLARQLRWRQGKLTEPENPSEDEKGAKLYQRLRDKLDSLKARKAPPAVITYKALHALGGGMEGDAFISSNHDVGSEPHGEDPPIWEDLTPEYRHSKSYVRGHLISMRLGGEGIWKNMMPITNTVNGRMNTLVETKLKKSTGTTGRYYHYNVKAEYADNKLEPLPDKAPAATRNAHAIAAEKRLLRLSWKVEPAADKDGKLVVDNSIPLLDVDGNSMEPTGGFSPPTITS